MTTINWGIAEARLQTLLDRADFLSERVDFLDGLASADFRRVMLQVTDGAVLFCEKPIIDGVVSRQPSSASRKAALSRKEKVLAEYTKINNEIDKVRAHLELRVPEDAGT
jgi:hypothetical protein